METTVAVVDDHMEGDIASKASQDSEDTRGCTPHCDIIESSKLKLSSDLEKSLKFTHLMGFAHGMIGTDFHLVIYGSCSFRCHKFMLASRSKVFQDMFMANPTMSEFKLEPLTRVSKAAPHNMLMFIYTGMIDDVPLEAVSDHLWLAATCKLEPMAELVQKKLIDSLDPSNCIKYLITALSDPLLLGLKEKRRQSKPSWTT